MSVDISHENGRWSFSYRPHVLTTIGSAFLVAGLGALVAPWWLPLISAATAEAGMVIDGIEYWIGVPLIAIGLLVLFYKYLIVDPRSAKLGADRKMLTDSPLLIDDIRYYLSDLVDDHSYRSSFDTKFYEVYTRFAKSENRFQYNKTHDLYCEFVECASRLHRFALESFDVFPISQGHDADLRYCLEPRLNIDRDMHFYDAGKTAQYDVKKNELHKLTKETKKLI